MFKQLDIVTILKWPAILPFGGLRELAAGVAKLQHPWYSLDRMHDFACCNCTECAFGMLVNKWAVLQQPLRGKFSRHKDIVSACMILHNLCTNHCIQGGLSKDDCPRSTSISDVVEFCNATEKKFPANFSLYRDAINKKKQGFFKNQQGRRRRQERSSRRDKEAAAYILDQGDVRGCLSQWLHMAGLVRPKRRTFSR